MKRYGYVGLTESDTHNNKAVIKLVHIAQIVELKKKGGRLVGKLVIDTAFRTKASMKIDKLIETLKEGNVIVICDLKFLARTMNKLLERLDAIEARGAKIEVLNIEGNSLAAHAKALRDFNKFSRGGKIRATMLEQTAKNNNNGIIKNTKSLIQCWDEQHSIAVAKNTGKATVIELAKKHKVSRQAIYRICNKKVFKDVKAPYTYDIETWQRWRFRETIYADIDRNVEPVQVKITTANKLLELHSYTTDNTRLQRPAAQDEYLDKPDEELDKIFERAVQKKVKQWRYEQEIKIEDNIKKRGEKQKIKIKQAQALALKQKKAKALAIKTRAEVIQKLTNGENTNE
jgi:hypothetical protein